MAPERNPDAVPPLETADLESVFRALADPTRRALLDRLRDHNGQPLGELCRGVGMTRQSVTQHLDLLAAANLVVVVRSGRERLHYLNPEPIHRIQERWIARFDRPHLDRIAAIREHAEALSEESTMSTEIPDHVYVTYIRASAEQVWQALTDADLTARYWGHRNVSDWAEGSTWQHVRLDSDAVDVVGRVLETDPPRRLRITFEGPDDFPSEAPSIVTFEIEPGDGSTRLTVTHTDLVSAEQRRSIAHSWSAVLSNLKTLLETGETLSPDPWETHPA